MKYILVLALVLLTPLVAANLQMQEVLYDPINTESGGEAIQLHNPTDAPIDISNYVIKTPTSAADATIPEGTLLQPNQYYLVADTNWAISRDNMAWPEADYEEAITLKNTDGGVAILNPEGVIMDSLCWGAPSEYCLGDPAPLVQPGFSLLRVSSTNNNANDFIESEPQFSQQQQQQQEQGCLIQIIVPVRQGAEQPVITSANLLLDDNPDTQEVEILPLPGEKKFIPLEVDSNALSVKAVVNNKEFELIKDIKFQGNLEMDYFDEPGAYTVQIIAETNGVQTTQELSFEYLPLLALEIDTAELMFSQGLTIQGDQDRATQDKPTITNLGNTIMDLGVYGTDLASGQNMLDVSSLKYSFDNDFASAISGTLTKDLVIKEVNLQTQQKQVFGLQVSIPQQTPEGDYTGSLSVIGVAK